MAWFKGEGFEDFRLIHESNGYVVAGRGRRIACDSVAEAEQVIRELYGASSTAGRSGPFGRL
jgi:hypothetical protein